MCSVCDVLCVFPFICVMCRFELVLCVVFYTVLCVFLSFGFDLMFCVVFYNVLCVVSFICIMCRFELVLCVVFLQCVMCIFFHLCYVSF